MESFVTPGYVAPPLLPPFHAAMQVGPKPFRTKSNRPYGFAVLSHSGSLSAADVPMPLPAGGGLVPAGRAAAPTGTAVSVTPTAHDTTSPIRRVRCVLFVPPNTAPPFACGRDRARVALCRRLPLPGLARAARARHRRGRCRRGVELVDRLRLVEEL